MSAGADSVLVLNNLRRRAVRHPLKWNEYWELMRGIPVRRDLSGHIGLNGRVVQLRCAYYHFPDKDVPPTLTLVAVSRNPQITDAEAAWIRESNLGPLGRGPGK